MNKSTNEIFQLYYSGQINKIIDIIDKDNTIDFYCQNQNNKTLLDCLLLTNNIELIQKLINKNVIINYLDIKGRSILYNIIKNKFNGILKLLIDNDPNLLNIIDKNGLLPIHYTILFNNIDAFKILCDILKLNKISNIVDNKGNDICNYIVLNNNLNSIQYFKILNFDKFYDKTNNNNMSFLMNIIKSSNNFLYDYVIDKIKNIDFDCQEIVYDDYLLSYFIKYKQQKNLLKILKNQNINNIDFNKQDKKCQTIVHILLRDIYLNIENASDDIEILRFLIISNNNTNIDYYIYDIKMVQPSHLIIRILNHLKENLNEKNKQLYNLLLEIAKVILLKSDINFQNLKFSSPMHLICKNKLFKDFSDILVKKFLNLNLKDSMDNKPLDYLNEDEKKEFMPIIIQSYINFLTNHKNFNIDLKYNTNEELKNMLSTLITNNDFNFCQKITNNICKFSIPQNFKNIKQTDFYFGSSLDIICGCKYLVNKYKIYFPYNKKVDDNTELTVSYFYKINNINTYNDIVFDDNFMFWHSENLKLFINKTLMDKIQKKLIKYDIIIIPLLIYNSNFNTNHMNMIIIQKQNNKTLIYRYDPYGLYYNNKFNYDKLNNEIQESFQEIGIYIDPSNYLLKTGIQILEENMKNIYLSDNTGYCIIWCIFFCDLFIENEGIEIQKIIKYIITDIFNNNINLKSLIKNYSTNIINVRKKILGDLNIDINDYYNNELKINKYYEIMKYKIE
jgi:hypothetical protein